MIKLYLKKNRFGYKICVHGCNSKLSYHDKLGFKPKLVVGFIVDKQKIFHKKGFILLVDFVQLNYWLSLGAQCSKSLLKFIYFIENHFKVVNK